MVTLGVNQGLSGILLRVMSFYVLHTVAIDATDVNMKNEIQFVVDKRAAHHCSVLFVF